MSSIFDSESEKRKYSTVRTYWSKFLAVYPRIPVRKVLGDKLNDLSIQEKAKAYLLASEFDFVVCDHSESPFLAVELDGLGHGFLSDGAYIQPVVEEDPLRQFQIEAKIGACESCDTPLVVVSYPETESDFDPDCPVTILDAVIGEVLTSRKRQKELTSSNLEELDKTPTIDFTHENTESYPLDLEGLAEHENPVRRRIKQMQTELPVSFGLHVHPLRDKHGYDGARQLILGGIELSVNQSRQKVLLSCDAYVRNVNLPYCNAFELARILAEYGLARKAIRTIGKSKKAWQELQDNTPWMEI